LATDDFTLVKRVRGGDQRAFRILVERYQKKLYAFALGMIRDKQESMEIAQEAFAKVYKHLDYFKGEASFETWLFRIARNLCIDLLRRRAAGGRREQVEFDETAETELEHGYLGFLGSRLGTNPQHGIMRKELARKIEEAIQQLPEKHREVLLLRELEGMAYEDLSRILKVPKGTVMSRLFHARAHMQKILSEYLDLEGEDANLRRS
jgi:RNA polymerase sigma-70 factor, ECF subfamily